MSLSRLASSFALLGCLGWSAAQAVSAVRIPPVHGAVLTGEKVDLPEGLRGKVGVLVIGFSQASRDEVEDWGRRLDEQYRSSAAVAFYEMPVLESVPHVLRGFVLKQIERSVSTGGKRRFLPILDHEADWKKAAGFVTSDDAYVLVVDGGGQIEWTTRGKATTEMVAETMSEVERLRDRTKQREKEAAANGPGR